MELLIRGALVVDGSGGEPFPGDVVLGAGRIVAVGAPPAGWSGRVLDAGGLVLAPGFIDIHSHTDATIFKYPGCESKLFQGVTTEVTGNCGLSPFPWVQGREAELAAYLRLHDFHLPADGITWHDLSSYAEAVAGHGPGINLAPLVGHAALRIAVMGMTARTPDQTELARMELLLAKALEQGAWGLSTGLIYPPGCYAEASELVALARIAARFDTLYASHIRGESETLMTALGETVAIGRESGVRTQVSHLKALGAANRGRAAEILAFLASARAAGVDIAADQYPYAASATTLAAVVPAWAHEGGVARLLERLDDPGLREQLVAQINGEMARREGADRIMVSGLRSQRNRRHSGRSVAELAGIFRCSPAEAVIRLLVQERGEVGAIFFSMAEEDVATILAQPEVAVGSDGHGLHAEEAGFETTHPRSYGTFPRVLGHYVRERQLLSLAAAVRKMTSLPASRLGMTDRGTIRPGGVADLVLFDPAAMTDLADYADPHRYASGVVHLFLAGQAVIRDNRLTGVRCGRVLRKGME